jgi:hypothetical protein
VFKDIKRDEKPEYQLHAQIQIMKKFRRMRRPVPRRGASGRRRRPARDRYEQSPARDSYERARCKLRPRAPGR